MTSVLAIVTTVVLIHLSFEIGRCSMATNDHEISSLKADELESSNQLTNWLTNDAILRQQTPQFGNDLVMRKNKEHSVSKAISRIIGKMVFLAVIIWLYGLCRRCCCRQKNNHESVPVQLTSIAVSDNEGNQTIVNANNLSNLIPSSNSNLRQQFEVNDDVSLMVPRGKDSLPTFEEAMRMASAPPSK